MPGEAGRVCPLLGALQHDTPESAQVLLACLPRQHGGPLSLGSAELLPHPVPPGSSSCPRSLWVTTWPPPASHLLLALPETLLASPDSDLRPGLVAVPCSPTPALLLTPARPSAPGVCCPGCLGCSLDTGLILHLHPKDLSPPRQGWRVTTDPGSAWRLERPYSDPAAL